LGEGVRRSCHGEDSGLQGKRVLDHVEQSQRGAVTRGSLIGGSETAGSLAIEMIETVVPSPTVPRRFFAADVLLNVVVNGIYVGSRTRVRPSPSVIFGGLSEGLWSSSYWDSISASKLSRTERIAATRQYAKRQRT
jgi:hypothetical protein